MVMGTAAAGGSRPFQAVGLADRRRGRPTCTSTAGSVRDTIGDIPQKNHQKILEAV
jgi:hypothetical protein